MYVCMSHVHTVIMFCFSTSVLPFGFQNVTYVVDEGREIRLEIKKMGVAEIDATVMVTFMDGTAS